MRHEGREHDPTSSVQGRSHGRERWSLSDCHALTSRYDEHTDIEGAFEVMIVHGNGDLFYAVQRAEAYRDLWRSPSGRLYVAAYSQMTWSDTPTQNGGGWITADVPGTMRRVSGVDDELVFGYGWMEMNRFDGRDWHPVEQPGRFNKIHGPSADLVYGVGEHGLIARWNGSGWDRIETNVRGDFRDVWVVSEDEMYAVHEGGLWEGSVHGWKPRLNASSGKILSVAKWKGELWVGTSDLGLCKLAGDQLTVVKDKLHPKRMDARGALLTIDDKVVACTEDGERFRGWKLQHAVGLWRQNGPPAWVAR